MRKILFYFRNNQLCCSIKSGKDISHYTGNKAMEKLAYYGDKRYLKVDINDSRLILKTKATQVCVKDLEKFIDEEYIYFFEDSFVKIRKAILEHQRNEAKINKIKTTGKKALGTASIIVLILLAVNAYSKKHNNDNTKLPEVPATIEEIQEPILEQNEVESIIYESNNAIEELQETAITSDVFEEYNELYEELDSEPVAMVNDIAFVNYEHEADLDKQLYVEENFDEIVTRYATKWGISPNLVMNILTQESGGKVTNLMQIQFDSWKDMPLSSHNFVDNCEQTIVLTDNPEKYRNKNYTVITREDLKNKITNISVGCVILKYSIEEMNNHIAAGIQCYNFGTGNMMSVLAFTSEDTGLSIDEILSDQSNVSFMNYTDSIKVGDSNYLENVSVFNNGEPYYVYEYNDGEIIPYSVLLSGNNYTL